ncbi:AAA family ATPase [Sphingobium phenoxybenzoativorans]|uniref:AAA family ATPase n=1 Tax=Sphingobium phenoxybenzoativorans TaxID=1592790 RepID=A0A975K2V1_9SPHN|nr:AAA family ATPase [Sphingobium phenoxybenzoativorans]QUT03900.1 AAA family ATPase [Sphingobium phenoxybenzoativorans]
MTPYFGQDEQARTLMDAAAGGRMHHGWILAGPKGIGKAAFARAAALRLLADAAGPSFQSSGLDVPDDHRIARLFVSGAHPDYAELERLEKDNGDYARNISVDQVRGLQRLFSNVPSFSDRRVIVIDSADDLERGAANALLKNLEEPPAGTIFLLVSHAPARLLPTIRSRCRLLRFSPLPDDQMRQVLRQNLPDLADDGEMEALIAMGQGSPGRALEFAGLGLAQVESLMREILTTGDPDNSRRLMLAKMLSPKAARPRYEALLERGPAFIAAAARAREGRALATAVDAWEQARSLAAGAVILSLDPSSVVFELCSLIAGIADVREAA